MPFEGVLNPKQRETIQIRFMPMEDEDYEQKLTVVIADSIQRIDIDVSGTGMQPKLQIDQSIIELGPVLPFAVGKTFDLKVKNPSLVPVEFYSLDFDEQYLEEEKVLREQKGYDAFGNLMLPPRSPGQSLPSELMHKSEVSIEDEEEDKRHVIEKHDPVQLGQFIIIIDFYFNMKYFYNSGGTAFGH